MEISELQALSEQILRSTGEVFVGDGTVTRKMLCASLADGHVLFEDNPGLGKTLLAKVFARVSGCAWGRVQFTPDMMPADILGTRIWKDAASGFVLEKGPVFTNVLLADEINRAPPKTQSALLEAMEEKQVTIEGTTHRLGRPFFVIATQNPIELEGTFPLPEAELDRFLLKLSTGYVETIEMESEILRRRIRWKTDDPTPQVRQAVTSDQFLAMQDTVESAIYIDGQILDYVSQIIRATREHPAVEVGSSPRGGLGLLKLSRAHAAICGRDFVIPDDVKMFTEDALSHRVILSIENEIEGLVTPRSAVAEVVSAIEPPRDFTRRRTYQWVG
jgi:MoxR-like ATPase